MKPRIFRFNSTIVICYQSLFHFRHIGVRAVGVFDNVLMSEMHIRRKKGGRHFEFLNSVLEYIAYTMNIQVLDRVLYI